MDKALSPNETAVLAVWEAGALEGRDLGRKALSDATGLPRGTVRHIKKRLIARGKITNRLPGDSRDVRPTATPGVTQVTEELPELIKGVLQRQKDQVVNVLELADKVDRGPIQVRAALEELYERGFNLIVRDESVSLTKGEELCPRHVVPTTSGKVIRFGVLSDTHLCNAKERLDALDAVYQWYADEGIDTVYHCGNWIEGESRVNVRERTIHGMDAQCNYFCEHYPLVSGIKTRFISGKCHEGWYQEREGISIGRHLQGIAEAGGRTDLEYLGYIMADVAFENEVGVFHMRLFHPGGGKSYARSYSVQKHIEVLQGGEKPAVMLFGHYHTMDYLPQIRNVRAIQCGCFVECGAWGAGKALEYDVGGWIVELVQDEQTGACIGARVEDRTFFDKGYYSKFEPGPWNG